VSIVLAMLVLFVLVVVVFEIRYSASVEQDQARMIVEGRRMGLLADAGRRQAESALILDVEQGQGEEGNGGAPGGDAGGAGGDGGGAQGDGGLFGGGHGGGGDSGGDNGGDSGGDGESGDGSTPDVAQTTASTDSRLDDWNDPLALAPAFGEDFQVLVEVEDEDSKINLLGEFALDQDVQNGRHEILIALLDKAFEGTSLDISFSDAIQILDRLDDWARGTRGAFDPIPSPPLKKSNAEDAAEAGGTDQAILTVDEKERPLTLDELGLLEGIKPEHLRGFVENDEFHPGLERYLTLWSELELKPPPPEPDPFANSPFSKFTQGSLFDKQMGQSQEQQPETPPDVVPAPTNNGLVNVNTAPLVVLRALAPTDVPTSFLEKLDEYRRKIDELKKEGAVGASESLFSKDKLATPGEKKDSTSGSSGSSQDDEQKDPTKYVFSTVDEVIDKVEQEFGITLGLDPNVQSTFLSRLAVTSNVFTIKVLVYTLVDDQSNVGHQRFGRHASYRTVVWRMVTDDGARMLTLLPFEPYFDPRRLKDYGLDLDQFGDDHDERLRELQTPHGAGF
jgi:hypothetical protein